MGGVLVDRVNGSSLKSVSQRYFDLHVPYTDRLNVDPRHLLSKPLSCVTVWPLMTAILLLWVISTDLSLHTCTHASSKAKEKEIEDFYLLGYDDLLCGKERRFRSA